MKNKVDKLYGKKIRKVQDLIKLKTDFEMVTPINKSGFGTIRFEDIRLKKNIHICAIFDKKLNITLVNLIFSGNIILVLPILLNPSNINVGSTDILLV